MRVEVKLAVVDTKEGWEIEVNGTTVLRWRGDGICQDQIDHEIPLRKFPETTTPHWRCLRMLFEEYATPIVSAITDGPSGSGLICALEQRGENLAERVLSVAWRMEDVATDAQSVADELRDAQPTPPPEPPR